MPQQKLSLENLTRLLGNRLSVLNEEYNRRFGHVENRTLASVLEDFARKLPANTSRIDELRLTWSPEIYYTTTVAGRQTIEASNSGLIAAEGTAAGPTWTAKVFVRLISKPFWQQSVAVTNKV